MFMNNLFDSFNHKLYDADLVYYYIVQAIMFNLVLI